MLSAIFSRRIEPYDFAQIIGSCTKEGREAGTRWRKSNVANGSDKGVQELATYFVNYHKALLGKPAMNGLLEPDASSANFRALELARDSTGRNKVLCSNLSHVSIARACHSLKLAPIVLDADPNNRYQVDNEELARAVSEHGKDIAAVVSTYGTTQLGNIEDLAERDLVKQLREDGAWLHVDAAYGGYIGTLSRHVKKKIPDADSITIDHYKFVGEPGIALLLIDRNKTPKPEVDYYVQSPFTLHTTLSAGPIASWYQTIKDCGDYVLQDMANECVRIAYIAGEQVKANSGKLVTPVQMSITPVELSSREEAIYVHGKLLEEGFSVGKMHIRGRNYETNGIRIVIIPRVPPEWQAGTALKLAGRISRLRR